MTPCVCGQIDDIRSFRLLRLLFSRGLALEPHSLLAAPISRRVSIFYITQREWSRQVFVWYYFPTGISDFVQPGR